LPDAVAHAVPRQDRQTDPATDDRTSRDAAHRRAASPQRRAAWRDPHVQGARQRDEPAVPEPDGSSYQNIACILRAAREREAALLPAQHAARRRRDDEETVDDEFSEAIRQRPANPSPAPSRFSRGT